jgi:hypothetical protein
MELDPYDGLDDAVFTKCRGSDGSRVQVVEEFRLGL